MIKVKTFEMIFFHCFGFEDITFHILWRDARRAASARELDLVVLERVDVFPLDRHGDRLVQVFQLGLGLLALIWVTGITTNRCHRSKVNKRHGARQYTGQWIHQPFFLSSNLNNSFHSLKLNWILAEVVRKNYRDIYLSPLTRITEIQR